MSNTKQCACCDLHYDPYELDTVGQFLVCEDCIDGCPTDNNGTMICNISGRAAKPAVEQAIGQFMVSNGAGGLAPGAPIPQGFGTTGTHHIDGSICHFPTQGTCTHPSHAGNPTLSVGGGPAQPIQTLQQFFQQHGAPPPPCAQCQHGKAARGCSCAHCTCGCASCAGTGQQDAGTNGATALNPCPDCEGTGASRKPKPPPKHLTKTQSAPIDGTLERLKLQLKAGLNDQGRPLTNDERKALERQVEIWEPSEDEEARELLGTYDAEIRALLGVKEP